MALDRGIGERELAQLVLRRINPRGDAGADFAVDLHWHDDLLSLRDGRIECWPLRLHQSLRVPEQVPQFLGGVRRERRQHHDQRIHRLPQHGNGLCPLDASHRRLTARRNAVRGALAEIVDRVDQLHQRRHGGVEVHPLLDVHGDAANRVVRFPPQLALRVGAVVATRRDALAADRLRPVIDDAPNAEEKTEAALEPGVGPLDFLLRRRDEHHVQTQRVGAVLLHHVVGIDDVALRLRHDVAVLHQHALREQALERLVEVDQAHVAQHAREEARVQQVQNRVLDAAAVEIDRQPIGRGRRIERHLLVVRVGKAEEIP